MNEYQTSVVKEFQDCVEQIDTVDDLMRTGVHLFTISYIDTIIKACWPIFSSRLRQIAPSDPGKTTIAIDVPAIFHAAYSVVGDAAVEETANRVRSIIDTLKDGKDAFVFLAMDDRESWRRELCQEFKVKRPPKPDGFVEVLSDTKAHLVNAGYRMELHEGMESDDIMASVAFRSKLRKHTCYLVTDDRDLLQCIGSGTTCFAPRSGKHKDENWLLAEMHLTPKQVVDYLCLVGKDDIPSAHKIGDVTATKLLTRCGNFYSIIDSLDDLLKAKEVTAKQAESLREYSSKYLLAKKLHTKLRNLEVNW
jgi:DNA polymerase-1